MWRRIFPLRSPAQHPERQLRRLERQIARYQALQLLVEEQIQHLCAEHLALQVEMKTRPHVPPSDVGPSQPLPRLPSSAEGG
ncbi:hypothetical protein A4R35_23575 [Thermogemmatispora tikiterensis]|uniref:Uncharacterized protein n=1 Tax=Thermogemmatispora tikiterensis TaxID=1825093 RepID=A0A328VED6_9CHLR|nr:hypothetical protein A4R35_23575 [Thermogemmatispora tikiterensis]